MARAAAPESLVPRAPDALPTMAYTRQKAEAIVTGLESLLNNHLLKLAAVPSRDVRHWKNGAIAWLTQIAAIRLKPGNRPAGARFYFRLLYEEPFGGVELQNIGARLQLLRLEYGRLAPEQDPAELTARLQAFHSAFAQGCAAGALTRSKIAALVDDFTAGRHAAAD